MKLVNLLKIRKLGIVNLAGRIRLRTWIALGLIVILLPMVLWTLYRPGESEATWFNDNWLYRKKITIDYNKVIGSSNFTDFPILINQATDADLAARAQSDGDDIVFTDLNGRKLDHEIERYTSGTGELVAWVKVPTLYATANTILYMYYGNATVSSQQNAREVWDSNFVMVHHMEETTSGNTDFKDSTYNRSDSVSVAFAESGSNPAAAGKVDGGIQLSGDALDGINMADSDNFTQENMTIECWVKFDDIPSVEGDDEYCMIHDDSGGFHSSIIYFINGGADSNKPKVMFMNNTGSDISSVGTTVAVADTWYHITGVKDGSNVTIYVNGSTQGTPGTWTGTHRNANGQYMIGGQSYNWLRLDGYIDEVRVQKTNRSADWIATNFNTQNHLTSAFYTLDSQETGHGPTVWWKFDEGADNTCSGGIKDTCDSTQNGNDGAFGASTAAPSWKTEDLCVFGKCLYFDGTDDVVTVSNTVSGVKTATFWAKVMSTSTTEQLIDLNGTDYLTSTSGTITANEFGTETIYIDGQVGSTVTANKWHHVAVTTSTGLSASAIKMGQISTNYGNVFLDDIRFYTYARSADQIKVDYANGAAVLGVKTQGWLSNGLVGYWKMDEASGTTVTDYSGNSHTGTLSNAQETGTAEADSSTTTVIADDDNASLAASNDAYNNMIVRITGGGGCGITIGTERLISDYAYTATPTREITVATAFAAETDDCTFEIRHQNRGKFANGIKFDDDNDYVLTSGNTTWDSLNDVTVSFWAKADTPTATRYLFSKSLNTTNRWGLRWVSNNYVQLYDDINDAGNYDCQTPGPLSTDTWYYITITMKDNGDGTFANQLYIDGVSQNCTRNSTGSWSDYAGNLYLGKDATSNSTFKGVLDEFRVYNRALSTKEIRNLYNWAPGPFAYWSMDENTGTSTVYDRSGSTNTHNATMNGSMTVDDWVLGRYGSGLDFDGSDDRLTVTDHDDFSPSAITQEAWVKYNSLPSTNGQNAIFIYKDYSPGAPWNSFGIYGNSGSSDQFTCFTAESEGGSAYSYSGITPTIGVWYHVACTWDGSYQQLYINGVLRDSDVLSGSQVINSSDTLEIGGASTVGYSKAVLDEVKIYNYARTPGQIVEDMNAGHSAPGSPVGSPLGYWKFDEGADNTCSGGINDVCNAGSQGTTLDSTSTATRYSSGKIGQALDFDGADDVVTATNTNAIDFDTGLHSGVTFSAWVNPDTVGEGTGGEIFRKSSNTYCRLTGSTPFNLACSLDLSTPATLTVNSIIPASTWTYVALAWTDDSDDEITLYINGVPRGTSTNGVGPNTSDTSNLSIGGGTSNNFDGKIDEFKVYSSELTEDQIKVDYNFGAGVNLGTSTNDAADFTDGAGNGPIAYWPLDENAGTSTVYDKSGSTNTYNASLTGITADEWVAGKYGSAIKFSESGSDYANAGDINELDGASAFTISAWMKELVFDDWGEIMNKNGADSVNKIVITYGASQGQIIVDVSNNPPSTNGYGTASNAYTTNQWFHFTTVYDGSGLTDADRLKIYINGVLQTLSFTNSIATTTDDNANSFNFGMMDETILDEVKVYNYARTPAQVAYDYNRGGPVGYWKFDECQGATAYDSSEQDNNGTITTGGSLGTCAGSSGEMWYDGATGKYNSSLDFSGTGDWVDMNDQGELDFIDGEDLSVCAWIKRDDDTNEDTIVAKTNSQTSQGYVLYIDSANDDINFALTDDTPDTFSVNSKSTISTGIWYHVCGVFDESSATTSTIYINGREDKEGTSGTIGNVASLANSVDFRIGSESDNGEPFDGLIDDVRVYRYALSAAQVRKVMNQSAVRFGPNTGSP